MMTPWLWGNNGWADRMWGNAGWGFPGFIVPLALWSVLWTGLVLWYAARREEKGWFIFFLLVHTAGIVELIYLIFIAKAFAEEKPRRSTRKMRS